MSLSLREIRRLAYELPFFGPRELGWYGVASAISTTAVTDVTRFGNREANNSSLEDARVILPNRSGNDLEKALGLMDGAGAIAHREAQPYSTTFTNEPYEVIRKGFKLAELNRCVQDAMRELYFANYSPMADCEDADFGFRPLGDVGAWPVSHVSVTRAKTADASLNLSGFFSLDVTYNTADKYVFQSSSTVVQPLQQRWVGAGAIIVGQGPAILRMWDESHGREIGYAQALGGEVHLGFSYTVPEDCFLVRRRLECGTAGGRIAWDYTSGHALADLNPKTPAEIDANWKLLSLNEAHYRQQAGGTDALYASALRSRQYKTWFSGQDYATENEIETANPNAIQVLPPRTSFPACDMFYYAQRQESSRSQLLNETDTTNFDREMIMHAVTVKLCQLLRRHDGEGSWRDVEAAAQKHLDAQRIMRRPTHPSYQGVRRSVRA